MNMISVIMAVFAMLGAFDRLIGDRFGLGKEFERGFRLFGDLALSMIGMIIISPLLADLLGPVFELFWEVFHIDPSIIPAALFSIDMGGAPLAVEVAVSEQMGKFNGLVVASMMGATISFAIPYSLNAVRPERHKWLLLGLLCGVVTIPPGCLVAGVMLGIPFGELIYNMLPLILFSVVIAVGLIRVPELCTKIFGVVGVIIKLLITIGLGLGVLRFLTGVEVVKGLATLEEGTMICLSCCAIMSGAFPLLHILSRLLAGPLEKLRGVLGINENASVGLVSTLAANITAFDRMNEMDDKGITLNAAFAVSAACTFADHLAFTLAFDKDYLAAMMIGKLVAGVLSVAAADFIYRRNQH
ncbi:MAG: ethanolamine utilization protein EutH [Lachnospiraceae bacterium]|nr:ethanolamine utilization protein EutH [Lachnospiraceae bacterium]